MRSRARTAVFAAVVLLAAALFVALGFWQLDRLEQRRSANERKRQRLEAPVVELVPRGRREASGRRGERRGAGGTAARPSRARREATGSDRERRAEGSGAGRGSRGSTSSLPAADSLDWRRVVVRGRFDYAREIVLGPRSFHGTPGVYLLTPLVVGDSTAVPVLRGGMPAPDGFHAALEQARPRWARPAAGTGSEPGAHQTADEDDGAAASGRSARSDSSASSGPAVTVRGVALVPPAGGSGTALDTLRAAGRAHPVLKTLDLDRVRRLLPWRVPGFYVRADSTTERIPAGEGPLVPTPVALPALDDGPHLMYAIQWFSFAAIAVIGGGVYLAVTRKRRKEEGGDGG